MKKLLFGMVGVAGFAASVNAAATWTTQIQFVKTGGPADIPNGTVMPVGGFNLSSTGTYTFTVQVGIFNLQGAGAGQSNQGLFDWTANGLAAGLTGSDSLGVNQSNSRVAPFNFGPATSFGGTVAANTIANIDAARDVSGGATNAWLWDADNGVPGPQPTAPGDWAGGNFAPRGANAYTNVFRFQVNVGTLAGPNIQLTFSGAAGPVLSWALFGANEPTEDTPNGNVSFLGITRGASDGGPIAPYNPATLQLNRVPAPGSIALLGLGGLLAARRRRA